MKCKVCLEEKSESDFYKNSLRCKKCRSIQCNEWRKNNREKIALARKKNQINNKEAYLEKNREYYQKNHEKRLESARKWRENNRQKTRDSTSKWQKNNRDKINEYVRNNKEKQKEYAKRHKEKNLEKFKENIRKNIKISKERFPEKYKARKIVFCALRVGHLIRPTNCSRCLKECKPEGHHPDYSKPLEVVWLCKKCHIEEHKWDKKLEEPT